MNETTPLFSEDVKTSENPKRPSWIIGVGFASAALLFIGTVTSNSEHVHQSLSESRSEVLMYESQELYASQQSLEDVGEEIDALDVTESKDANVLTYLSNTSSALNETGYPNILFVFVDDMGFNDIGYLSTDLEFATPAMDALAADGVTLTRYYTMSSCTPARASLLTGKYASKIGMGYDGDASFCIASLYGMSLNHKTLGEAFRDSGYETHIVGKWNVGHYRETYWPHKRGFDTFYGYNGDEEKYYSHKAFKSNNIDLCDFAESNYSTSNHSGKSGIFVGDCHHGDYSTDLYTDRIKTIIQDNYETDPETPWFLYFASQAVHAPLEAPPDATKSLTTKQLNMLKKVHRGNDYDEDGKKRYVFALMLLHLDEKLRDIVNTMHKYKALENSIIVVASDNGGCPQYGASNWPLRGTKFSSFEGGVHVPALFWSSRIASTSRGRYYDNLFHVTDWMPTLLDSAHSDAVLSELRGKLDGVSQWNEIAGKSKTIPRYSILLHLNAWHKVTNNHSAEDYSKWHVVDAPFKESLSAIIYGDWKFIMNMKSQDTVPVDGNYSATVCKVGMDSDFGKRYLFNITDDPEEKSNLASVRPEVADELSRVIEIHYEEAIKVGSNWRPCVTKTAFEVFKTYDYFVVPFEGHNSNIHG